MKRAKIVDATLAGTVTVEIELGQKYSNNMGKDQAYQIWTKKIGF